MADLRTGSRAFDAQDDIGHPPVAIHRIADLHLPRVLHIQIGRLLGSRMAETVGGSHADALRRHVAATARGPDQGYRVRNPPAPGLADLHVAAMVRGFSLEGTKD